LDNQKLTVGPIVLRNRVVDPNSPDQKSSEMALGKNCSGHQLFRANSKTMSKNNLNGERYLTVQLPERVPSVQDKLSALNMGLEPFDDESNDEETSDSFIEVIKEKEGKVNTTTVVVRLRGFSI